MSVESSEISSLSEYLAWTKEVMPASDVAGYALFYRGHSDVDFLLEPTAYRIIEGRSFRQVEHYLYEELLRLDPVAFASDKSTFERLVRMQHHGLPTRLLDLTHNPLIALYFACEARAETDGEVLLFCWKNEEVYQPSDVPRVAFAGICEHIDFEFVGNNIVTMLRGFFADEMQHKSESVDFDNDRQRLLDLSIQSLQKVEGQDFFIQAATIQIIEKSFFDELVPNWRVKLDNARLMQVSTEQNLVFANSAIFLERFCARLDKFILALINSLCSTLKIESHVAGQRLGNFLSQFTYYSFAYAPINNERIRRQKGAFIVCPPARTDFWKVEQHKKASRIRIPHRVKEGILLELSLLGITKSYVYPGLSELAADAKLRYPAR